MSKTNIRAAQLAHTPNEVIRLAENVYRQHVSMGVDSPLNCFDMEKFHDNLVSANAHLLKSKHLHAEGEANTQDAYNLIGIYKVQTSKTKDTLYYMLVLIRYQLLIVHYEEEELISEYGFNVVISRNRVRIDLQRRKPDAMLYLCERIYQKHTELGADSPLKAFNMESFHDKCTTAKALLEDARKFHEKAQAETELAHKTLGIGKGQTSRTKNTVYHLLGLIRRQLLVTYFQHEEALSNFGFNVVIRQSKKRKRKQPPPIND